VLRDALYLARRDLRIMLRTRETLLWTFVMPPVFFYFIGTITGGSSLSGARPVDLLVRGGPQGGFVAAQVVDRLGDGNFHVVLADTAADPSAYHRTLTFPPALTDSLLAGSRVRVALASEETSVDGSYEQFRIRRALYTTLGDLAIAARQGPPTGEALAAVRALPRTLTLDTRAAGKSRDIPTGFTQAVPGTMVMFTLLIMLTSGAVLLVVERRQGLLRRLASTPLTRGSVTAGKWGARLGLASIQIAFAMAIGTAFFHMKWGPDVPMLLLVLAAYAALCGALGIVLGNLARTERQAVAVGVIGSNVLAALGGCWWPIEVVPGWMQRLAGFLPTGMAMEALHNLVVFQTGPAGAVPQILIMAGGAVILGWVGSRNFRFQ